MSPSHDGPTPEEIARYRRATERMERDLARKISAWARTWERCPLAGCRRNGRCLHSGACRMHRTEPLTEEERLEIRRQIDALPDFADAPAER